MFNLVICHLSLAHLAELACDGSRRNQPFYHALIAILGSQDKATRLHYLTQINESLWKDPAAFNEVLFSDVKYNHTDLINEPMGKEQIQQMAISSALVQLHHYFVENLHKTRHTSHWYDHCDRYFDFVDLLIKISDFEIKDSDALKKHIEQNRSKFEKKTIAFFTVHCLSNRYSRLRDALVKAVEGDPALFQYLQKVTQVFIFSFANYIQKDKLQRGLIKEISEQYNPQGHVQIFANQESYPAGCVFRKN